MDLVQEQDDLEMVDDTVLNEEDLTDILDEVEGISADWEVLGTKLGIKSNTKEGIKQQYRSPDGMLNALLTEWLKLNYDSERHGKPTWRKLAKAVKKINGAVFKQIVQDHGKTPPIPIAAAVSAVSALPQATSVHPGDSKVADCQALGRKLNRGKLIILRYKSDSGSEEVLKVMDKVAYKWHDIGVLIGISSSVLKTYPKKHLGDDHECLREVLTKWIEMTSEKYPTTWQGLINLLEDVELKDVAVQIEIIATYNPEVL